METWKKNVNKTFIFSSTMKSKPRSSNIEDCCVSFPITPFVHVNMISFIAFYNKSNNKVETSYPTNYDLVCLQQSEVQYNYPRSFNDMMATSLCSQI